MRDDYAVGDGHVAIFVVPPIIILGLLIWCCWCCYCCCRRRDRTVIIPSAGGPTINTIVVPTAPQPQPPYNPYNQGYSYPPAQQPLVNEYADKVGRSTSPGSGTNPPPYTQLA